MTNKKVVGFSILGCFVVSLLISVISIRNIAWARGVSVNGITINSPNELDLVVKQFKNEHKVFADDELDSLAVNYYITDSGIKIANEISALKLIKSQSLELPMEYSINKEAVKNYIESWNSEHPVSEDAFIYKGDDGFYIQEEVYGQQIQWGYLEADLGIDFEEPIDLADYYIKPQITKSDLVEKCDRLNKIANWHISYYNGSIIQIGLDCIELGEDYEPIILNANMSDKLNSILDDLNTKGKPFSFVTSKGENIKVKAGLFGDVVNFEEELKFINENFKSLESIEGRVPIYENNRGVIGGTYIEISIQDQHIWYYKDDALFIDSDCVTGTENRRDTPTGAYYIINKVSGIYLIGADYKTWVDRWMAVTWDGIGLHDASWRNKFGGTIFKTNGSHGCINLPTEFIYTLYDNVEVGTPILIY